MKKHVSILLLNQVTVSFNGTRVKQIIDWDWTEQNTNSCYNREKGIKYDKTKVKARERTICLLKKYVWFITNIRYNGLVICLFILYREIKPLFNINAWVILHYSYVLIWRIRTIAELIFRQSSRGSIEINSTRLRHDG